MASPAYRCLSPYIGLQGVDSQKAALRHIKSNCARCVNYVEQMSTRTLVLGWGQREEGEHERHRLLAVSKGYVFWRGVQIAARGASTTPFMSTVHVEIIDGALKGDLLGCLCVVWLVVEFSNQLSTICFRDRQTIKTSSTRTTSN